MNKLYTFSWLSVFFTSEIFSSAPGYTNRAAATFIPILSLRDPGILGNRAGFIHVLFIHVFVGFAGLYSRAPILVKRAGMAYESRRILERYSRDSKFDQNTVQDSGNVYGLRDLTATREAGFAKIWARDARLGKKTIFGIVLTEVRDAGLVKKEWECEIRIPFLDAN